MKFIFATISSITKNIKSFISKHKSNITAIGFTLGILAAGIFFPGFMGGPLAYMHFPYYANIFTFGVLQNYLKEDSIKDLSFGLLQRYLKVALNFKVLWSNLSAQYSAKNDNSTQKSQFAKWLTKHRLAKEFFEIVYKYKIPEIAFNLVGSFAVFYLTAGVSYPTALIATVISVGIIRAPEFFRYLAGKDKISKVANYTEKGTNLFLGDTVNRALFISAVIHTVWKFSAFNIASTAISALTLISATAGVIGFQSKMLQEASNLRKEINQFTTPENDHIEKEARATFEQTKQQQKSSSLWDSFKKLVTTIPTFKGREIATAFKEVANNLKKPGKLALFYSEYIVLGILSYQFRGFIDPFFVTNVTLGYINSLLLPKSKSAFEILDTLKGVNTILKQKYNQKIKSFKITSLWEYALRIGIYNGLESKSPLRWVGLSPKEKREKLQLDAKMRRTRHTAFAENDSSLNLAEQGPTRPSTKPFIPPINTDQGGSPSQTPAETPLPSPRSDHNKQPTAVLTRTPLQPLPLVSSSPARRRSDSVSGVQFKPDSIFLESITGRESPTPTI